MARDRAPLRVGEALGEACCQGEGADEEDTWRLGGAHVLMLDVMKVDVLMLVMKVMKVKGLVTVKVLLEVKVLVVVKEFVVEALLFSLSSTPTQTTNPRTRPAALGLGLGR